MMQGQNNLQMVPINPAGQGPGNQINGPQIIGNQHGLWCIDWAEIDMSQLRTNLRSNWKIRPLKTMLIFFILFLASFLDIISDAFAAYKFLNGEKYVKRIQNQSDILVNNNKCGLINIMTNLTSGEEIGERYVLFFKITIFIYLLSVFAEIFINKCVVILSSNDIK